MAAPGSVRIDAVKFRLTVIPIRRVELDAVGIRGIWPESKSAALWGWEASSRCYCVSNANPRDSLFDLRITATTCWPGSQGPCALSEDRGATLWQFLSAISPWPGFREIASKAEMTGRTRGNNDFGFHQISL
jgi:hypothetical protein